MLHVFSAISTVIYITDKCVIRIELHCNIQSNIGVQFESSCPFAATIYLPSIHAAASACVTTAVPKIYSITFC